MNNFFSSLNNFSSFEGVKRNLLDIKGMVLGSYGLVQCFWLDVSLFRFGIPRFLYCLIFENGSGDDDLYGLKRNGDEDGGDS